MTDKKNLMHTMRLLLCAKSIAQTGVPKVHFEGEERDYLMGIRKGQYSYDEIMEKAENLMEEVDELFDKSSLPRSANIKKINRWYRNTMMKYLVISFFKEKIIGFWNKLRIWKHH